MRSRPLMVGGRETRRVPGNELKIIRPLVEKMAGVWEHATPPNSSLASHMVYGRSFMNVRRLSPFFPQVLGKRRLLDLGAGEPDAMIHFAMRSGVSQYVAVDRYCSYSDREPPFAGIVFVNEDMLMFLAMQPDNSANVAMLAIDDIVLTGPSSITETLYRGMLLAEIKRVVPPGGIAFGFNSDLLDGLEEMGFRKIEWIPGHRIPERFICGGIFRKSG